MVTPTTSFSLPPVVFPEAPEPVLDDSAAHLAPPLGDAGPTRTMSETSHGAMTAIATRASLIAVFAGSIGWLAGGGMGTGCAAGAAGALIGEGLSQLGLGEELQMGKLAAAAGTGCVVGAIAPGKFATMAGFTGLVSPLISLGLEVHTQLNRP